MQEPANEDEPQSVEEVAAESNENTHHNKPIGHKLPADAGGLGCFLQVISFPPDGGS